MSDTNIRTKEQDVSTAGVGGLVKALGKIFKSKPKPRSVEADFKLKPRSKADEQAFSYKLKKDWMETVKPELDAQVDPRVLEAIKRNPELAPDVFLRWFSKRYPGKTPPSWAKQIINKAKTKE